MRTGPFSLQHIPPKVLKGPRMTKEERVEQRRFRKLPLAEQQDIEARRLQALRETYDDILS